jgi:peptidoglycan-N-acetylglucosamine deacetylase
MERRPRGKTLVAAVTLALLVVAGLLGTLLSGGETDVALVPSPTGTEASSAPDPTPGPTTPTPPPTPTPTPATTPKPVAAPVEPPSPAPSIPGQEPTPPGSAGTPVAPASPALPAALVATEWERLPTTQRVVALTFDAGANAAAVPAILRTLQTESVPATFFLTGSWVERYPDLTSQIARDYPVGNHSYSHPDFTTLDDGAIGNELDRTAEVIAAVSGQDPRPLFRFPFGARDARTINAVNGRGYGSIRWTVDTLGWKGTTGGMSVDAVVTRVMDTVQPGQIVLMHVGSHPADGSMLDAEALPEIIRGLRAAGYGFVTVLDAL